MPLIGTLTLKTDFLEGGMPEQLATKADLEVLRGDFKALNGKVNLILAFNTPLVLAVVALLWRLFFQSRGRSDARRGPASLRQQSLLPVDGVNGPVAQNLLRAPVDHLFELIGLDKCLEGVFRRPFGDDKVGLKVLDVLVQGRLRVPFRRLQTLQNVLEDLLELSFLALQNLVIHTHGNHLPASPSRVLFVARRQAIILQRQPSMKAPGLSPGLVHVG
jgi:hypothetical protein